jgi:hypothetical protein
MDQYLIWPRDRASISVQQFLISIIHHCFSDDVTRGRHFGALEGLKMTAEVTKPVLKQIGSKTDQYYGQGIEIV